MIKQKHILIVKDILILVSLLKIYSIVQSKIFIFIFIYREIIYNIITKKKHPTFILYWTTVLNLKL